MGDILNDHLISFISIFLFIIISLYSYIGVFHEKKFISLLISLSSFGFLISFSISYNLNFGRYLVISYYFLTTILFLYNLLIKKRSFISFIINNKNFLFSLLLSGVLSIIYLVYNLKITFFYNGHDPYLYGIPFEILEGNYFQRVKIWDNYPKTWSKYHFFNGSINSIFLLFTGFKNIFLFKLYSIIVLIFLFNVLKELFDENRYMNKYFLSLLICIPSITWFFSSNGAYPLVFLTLSIFFYEKKNIDYSFLFLLFFTSSLSRHLIPGGVVLLFLFLYHWRVLIKFKHFYLILFPILNIISMVLSGNNPLKSIFSLNDFTSGKVLVNFLYGPGFQSLLFQNYLTEFIFNLRISFNTIMYLVSGILFLLILIKLKNLYHKIYYLLSIFFLIIFKISLENDISNNQFLRISEYSIMTLLSWFIHSTLIFSYPLYWFFQTSKFNNLKSYFLIFYLCSILNILILGVNSGIPNYYLISIILVFLVLLNVNIKFSKLNIFNIVLILTSMSVFFPVFDDGYQHSFDMKNHSIFNFNSKKNIIKYRSVNDTLYPILESNIYGKRIEFYENSNSLFHVSKGFID